VKAKENGDFRTAIMANDKIFTGLDIVNKVLGKYQTTPPPPTINAIGIVYAPEVINAANELSKRLTEKVLEEIANE